MISFPDLFYAMNHLTIFNHLLQQMRKILTNFFYLPNILVISIFILILPINRASASISLYGTTHAGLSLTNNNKTSTKNYHPKLGIKDEDWFSINWGVHGEKNINDRMNAAFVLESHIPNLNSRENPNKSEFWNQIYVQLFDKKLGTITAGRQYDSPLMLIGSTSPRINLNIKSEEYISNLNYVDSEILANNSIKYQSPKLNFLYFSGLFSNKLNSRDYKNNSFLWSTNIFLDTPINLGFKYLNIKKKLNKHFYISDQLNFTSTKKITRKKLFFEKKYTPSELSDLQKISLACSYSIQGNLEFQALISKTEIKKNSKSKFTGSHNIKKKKYLFDSIKISVNYKAKPTLALNFKYMYTNKIHLNQFEVISHYNVTKQTKFYVASSLQHIGKPSQAITHSINNVQKKIHHQIYLTTGLKYEF